MSEKTGKSVFLAVFTIWAVVVCACDQPAHFDALSAFPSNSKQQSIREIELIPVAGEPANKYSVSGAANPQPDEIPELEVVISRGVKGRAFKTNDSKVASGKFILLDAISAGFRMKDSGQMAESHIDKLSSPFTGSGIAIGDIDGDGLQDIAVASRDRGMRLFKNIGDLKFKDVTESVGIGIESKWGSAPVLVDINDDGLLDIYLCGYDSPNLLFINLGRKFKEQANRFGLDFQGASVGATFADYDRDGDLDMFLVTNRLTPAEPVGKLPLDQEPGKPPQIQEQFLELNHLIQYRDGSYRPVESGQFDRLFRNDGYRFVDVSTETKIGMHPFQGMSAIWWDFNNDGWPDLFIANDHRDADQLFQNNGLNDQGVVTFTDVAADFLPHIPLFSKGTDFGDLNNDGRCELLTTGAAGSGQSNRLMMTGNLYGPKTDAPFLHWGTVPQQMENAVLFNNGTDRFTDIARMAGLAATDWSWSVRVADLDNDGLNDLIYSNGRIRDFLNNDLNREFHASELTKHQYWFDQQPLKVPDRVFKNKGELQFEDVTEKWGLDRQSLTQTLATGDLDNDGDLDLVMGGFDEEVAVYRNDLTTKNSMRIKLVGLQSNSQGIGARVRLQVVEGEPEQTHWVSPTRGFLSTSEPTIHFGLGTATQVHRLEIDWPSGGSLKLFELKANYLYHLEEPKSSGFVSQSTHLVNNNSMFAPEKTALSESAMEELDFNDFEHQPLLPFQHSKLGPGICWGDIDGDGDYDMFRGGAAFDQGVIFENQGQLQFEIADQSCFESNSRSEDLGAIFFDADGDGDVDLYVVSGGVESRKGDTDLQDRLYLNDGTGQFEKAHDKLPDLRISGSSVSATDFDGDGRIDLFVGGRVQPQNYPETPQSVLLRNTDNGFVDVTEQVAPELAKSGMVTSSIWVDIDHDNRPDLMLSHEWGPIRCFRNDGEQLLEVTETAGLSDRIGLYQSLCAGDVDNDGDTDFVVGNLGLNTEYTASSRDPIHIYHGNFGDADFKQTVEAISVNGIEYPRRGLELLQQHFPQLEQKYSSVSQFAAAPLREIFSDQQLSMATHRMANSLESGILINESSPSEIQFSFKPLPRLAQTSPIYGSQLRDIDGDGHLDLYVIQNNSRVFAETVPFDNGVSLLLMGNGTGDFAPVSPAKSGLQIVGDGTALTAGDWDLDAKVDFIAATNDDGIHAFTNRSSHFPFALDMATISEGRNFIGAKIILELNNGSKQLHQISVNDGYLSQSPPIIFSGLKQVEKVTVSWPDGTTKSGSAETILGRPATGKQ